MELDGAQAFVDAFNVRDVEGMQRLVSEDFELIPLRAQLEEISYHGKDGIADWVRDVDEAWSELRIEIDSVEEPRAGTLLISGRVVGRGHESAAPVEVAATWVATSENGTFVRLDTFLDREAAIRAATGQT